MKANAKKLLALIMAFAMVMSLAAPAMAAGESNSLETQASVGATTTWVNDVEVNVNGYAVNTNEGRFPATGFSAWNSGASKDYVTVTATPLTSGGQVGTMQEVRYTVTPVAAFASPSNLAAKTITVADDTTKVKLTDSAIDAKFKEMSTTQDKFSDGSDTKQRKGFYYSEAQANGSYKVYFKLYPTQSVGTGTDLAIGFDESANHKWYYTMATNDSAPADTDISGLLKKSELVEPDGSKTITDDGYYKDRSIDATAYTNRLETYTETGYTFSVTGLDDIDSIIFDSSKPYAAKTTFKEGKNVGSFKVRMSTTINDGTKDIVVMEQDRDKVMATMTAAGKADTNTAWTVTSLSDTATNDYWTVGIAVKNTDTSNDYNDAASATDNTSLYVAGMKSNGDALKKAALVDTKEAGLYSLNGDSNKKTSISAGTEAFGFVAVYKEKLPTGVASPTSLTVYGEETDKNGKVYWTFASVDHMTKAFEGKNSDCGSTKSVPYVQGAVNAKLNGVENGAVDNKTGILTPVENWLAKDNIKTRNGSITLEKADHASYVKEVSTTKETCKKAGAKVTKIVCPVCGDVRATDTVEIPRVTTPLVDSKVHTAAEGYPHYIEEVEIVSTPATKDSKGTYTKKYKCNLGEYHEELEETKELDKTTLEHSGSWSVVQWGTQNTDAARTPSSLYGYTPFVLDTDVDYTEATLSTKDDVFFSTFDSVFTADGKQIDGTYYYTLKANRATVAGTSQTVITVEKVTKDATGKKTKTDAYYMGNAIVSNIKVGEKDCLDGSATITLNIYQATSSAYADASLIHPEKIEESLKQKKVTLLKTFTKDVVVPANKTHIDANNDGKCDNCGTEINQTTPVNENTVDISKAVVTFKAMTYTGKVAQPSVTVTLDGVKLAKGVDYEVEEMQDVNAGTYPLIVKGKGDFTGRVVGNVTIKKAKNPIKVAKTSVTVKAKDVKKKAKTIALKVTKAQGKVTVKSSKKKVVSWKSNKATVAKAAKKGTYKLTFTAKGNKNYKKGTKTVKVVVK